MYSLLVANREGVILEPLELPAYLALVVNTYTHTLSLSLPLLSFTMEINTYTKKTRRRNTSLLIRNKV